ncbi:MAG: hypothetical protein WCT52_06335 [Candidatus Micrarchaeia archaeon]
MWKEIVVAVAFFVGGNENANAQTKDTGAGNVADSSKAATWVPRNMASNLVNGFFLRCPLRPTEATILSLMDEKTSTINAIGNYATEFEGIRIGAGTVISSVYSNGNLSRTADIRVAAGNKTFQFGVVAPFQLSGDAGALSPSFHMGATVGNLRIGAGGSPFASETVPQSVYLSADVIFGDNAFSSTVTWNAKDRAFKQAYGLEKKFGNTQIGVSVHPERRFFGGKTNPFITGRHILDKSTILDIGYAPQQKRWLVGIGRRL